jgi:hypothetical protein
VPIPSLLSRPCSSRTTASRERKQRQLAWQTEEASQKAVWNVLVLLRCRMLLKIQGWLGKVFLREKRGALWLSPAIFRYIHPSSTLHFDQGSPQRVKSPFNPHDFKPVRQGKPFNQSRRGTPKRKLGSPSRTMRPADRSRRQPNRDKACEAQTNLTRSARRAEQQRYVEPTAQLPPIIPNRWRRTGYCMAIIHGGSLSEFPIGCS